MQLIFEKNTDDIEIIELDQEKLIHFFTELINSKHILLFGFKYYFTTLDNVDDIINEEIRKVSKILIAQGSYTDKFSEDENYEYVKSNAVYENDFWYTGYRKQLYHDPQSLWIRVTDAKEIEKAVELNRHFVCVVNKSLNLSLIHI